jgi:hypothetical protein
MPLEASIVHSEQSEGAFLDLVNRIRLDWREVGILQWGRWKWPV